MGNKQSSPTSASTKAEKVTGPPPLEPPCDLECEKRKKLKLLKDAFDKAEVNKDKDPEAYNKARIAYFTLLHGQGWLNTEKQRIAKENVQPIVGDFNKIYNSLKQQKQSQSMFANLANILEQDDSPELNKQMSKEKDKAGVLDRLNELNAGTPVSVPVSTNYWSYLWDALIVVFAVVAIYLGYTKFNKISSMFSGSTEITT